jgi:nucleoside-diphosphate-sugar epimerase
MSEINKSIFITGGTGYIGSRVIPELIQMGYDVHALVRPGSEKKIPEGCNIVSGDAMDRNTFKDKIAPCETFIQLVGVAHPGPGKKKQFEEIDLVSVTESVAAAKEAGIKHFIYMSVAEPAPVIILKSVYKEKK